MEMLTALRYSCSPFCAHCQSFADRVNPRARGSHVLRWNPAGRIDGLQFTPHGAPAGPHIQKVIIKTLVAARIGFKPLMAASEKTQSRERPRWHRREKESPVRRLRVSRQGKTDGRNAGWPATLRFVGDQTIGRVNFRQEILKRLPL